MIHGCESGVLGQGGMEVRDSHQFLLRPLLQGHGDPEVLEQVVQFLGSGLEVVFLHRVPHVLHHHHFEPALHLPDSQLLVHAFLLRSHQDLGHLQP